MERNNQFIDLQDLGSDDVGRHLQQTHMRRTPQPRVSDPEGRREDEIRHNIITLYTKML